MAEGDPWGGGNRTAAGPDGGSVGSGQARLPELPPGTVKGCLSHVRPFQAGGGLLSATKHTGAQSRSACAKLPEGKGYCRASHGAFSPGVKLRLAQQKYGRNNNKLEKLQ